MKYLNLTDTHMALILLQAFSPFGVFLMRQFYLNIPNELSEAARIDGLSEFGIYLKVMLPLAKPALASLGIFTFVFVWNDFLGPLIYINSNAKKTIQLGIRMFISQYSAEYSLIMAASVCSLLPVIIIFISAQKFFVEGIAMSGLKG
jgi:multiple sugar transport system permease protein